VLDPDACRRFLGRLESAAERLGGRRLWQVNSTEQGGGVAEMLHFLLGYLVGAGIDARWVVLEGNWSSSAVTKRIHHLLEDPSDLVGFGRAIQTLLTDRNQAQRIGEAAHRRMREDYLAPRRLTQELDLIERVAG